MEEWGQNNKFKIYLIIDNLFRTVISPVEKVLQCDSLIPGFNVTNYQNLFIQVRPDPKWGANDLLIQAAANDPFHNLWKNTLYIYIIYIYIYIYKIQK